MRRGHPMKRSAMSLEQLRARRLMSNRDFMRWLDAEIKSRGLTPAEVREVVVELLKAIREIKAARRVGREPGARFLGLVTDNTRQPAPKTEP